ncbi:MAG: hypothetical protein NXI30_02575 [bacterium]|nr:hypothetical protein [bacterium]
MIEDKTNTSHHSNQLDRALDAGRKFATDEETDLVCIYFKTGWVHEGDHTGRPEEFVLVERDAVLSAMRAHRGSHPYLTDWLAWLEEIDVAEEEAREEALDSEGVGSAFSSPVGLQAFARASFPAIGAQPSRHMVEYFGTSRGRPWRTIEFFETRLGIDTKTDRPEVLFWRFDTRNDVPIVSLRRYWGHDGQADEKDIARRRFHAYLERIESVLQGDQRLLGGLVQGRRSARSSTYREQELVVLMMGVGEGLNAPAAVARQLASITRAIDASLASEPIP